jgi:cysteinyl-tRNA synthetase
MNSKFYDMSSSLKLHNTLTRKKEIFKPINPPHVGLYVCGPTVYGDAHLGHARPAITFDLLFRYLTVLGYKVRYVRNITDVGHLENDADEGEDKIMKRARLEQLEPMEIVQRFTNSYHDNMKQLNVLPPSIEPRASGHIIEQIKLVEQVLEKGFAYVVNGSVYFDVDAYSKKYHYGKLSGRVLEDMLTNTRELEGQDEKHRNYDFALWKKAGPEHIMRWPSPWGEGFPGWHLECSAMSTRYLGERFDIHGGGMDLLFPHHECEIAQSVASTGKEPVAFWVHNNMITINGQKMGKSLGNFITLEELFSGNHSLLEKAYSPMTIRFFILQAHYRSTLDFSNEALKAAEKGLERLISAAKLLRQLKPTKDSSFSVEEFRKQCMQAMDDDLNSPVLIAQLFEGVRLIHSIREGKVSLKEEDLISLRKIYDFFLFDILGLQDTQTAADEPVMNSLVDLALTIRMAAKAKKDFQLSDHIRDELTRLGFEIRDTKEGFEWNRK